MRRAPTSSPSSRRSGSFASTAVAQRYLTHDALNAIWQATHRIDADKGTDYHQRFVTYLHQIQDEDLTLGVAMTDAKGDRSKRPHEQQVPKTYIRIVERRPDGIVILGTKAIVTGAAYVHGFLVMPCRNIGARTPTSPSVARYPWTPRA